MREITQKGKRNKMEYEIEKVIDHDPNKLL